MCQIYILVMEKCLAIYKILLQDDTNKDKEECTCTLLYHNWTECFNFEEHAVYFQLEI